MTDAQKNTLHASHEAPQEKVVNKTEGIIHEERDRFDEVLGNETNEAEQRSILNQKIDAMRKKYPNASFKWAQLERDSKPKDIIELLGRLEAAKITPDDFQAYYTRAVDLYRRKFGKPQGIPHAFQLVNLILNMHANRKQ